MPSQADPLQAHEQGSGLHKAAEQNASRISCRKNTIHGNPGEQVLDTLGLFFRPHVVKRNHPSDPFSAKLITLTGGAGPLAAP